MHISKSFIPILKNNPSEAKIKSHQLMLRVGMIKQSSAGIYSWLPLGFKVMKKIEQIGAERIAYFTFEGFGKEFVLVGEFFGDGNILLCNNEMKILALQHSIEVRHRKLSVGLEYAQPPENNLDIFNLTESNFDKGLGPILFEGESSVIKSGYSFSRDINSLNKSSYS